MIHNDIYIYIYILYIRLYKLKNPTSDMIYIHNIIT